MTDGSAHAERSRLEAAVRPANSLRSLLIAGPLAAVLLYLAFRGTDWTEILRVLGQAQAGGILIAVVGYSVSYLLRAIRWRVLLSAEDAPPYSTVFWATVVGYLGNAFLPARAGEVIRTLMLARRTRLGVGFILATALTERILDAATLVVVLLAILATLEGLPEWLVSTSRLMAMAGLIGIVGLFLAPRLASRAGALVDRLPLAESRRRGVAGLIERFLLGFGAVQSVGRALPFAGLTATIWAVDAFAAMMAAQALGLSVSFLLALLLLAALGLASAAPSTPGYVGIYQFVAVTVLVPFGLSQSEALAYILVEQGVIYAVVLIWGLPGLWRLTTAPAASAPADPTPAQVGG